MSEERMTGTVKWANPEKGFGFVEHEGDTYAFIPCSEIQAVDYRTLIEGERVKFVVMRDPRGLQASQVRRAKN